MKQINTSEANAIVGGTIPKTCYVKYYRDNANGGACMAATSCEDKFGNEVSSNTAEASNSDLCNGQGKP